MLYDNGQLLSLYSEAWLMAGDENYREVVEQTAAWLLREMRAPDGGFYCSLDADSEGEEGRFYVWQRAQARSLLDEQEYALLALRYGLGASANFEHGCTIWSHEILSAILQI
jgi:uncharacterized protein YyaL (SSP411 family)